MPVEIQIDASSASIAMVLVLSGWRTLSLVQLLRGEDKGMKKRAKALSAFQNDPPTTIFLLSMR